MHVNKDPNVGVMIERPAEGNIRPESDPPAGWPRPHFHRTSSSYHRVEESANGGSISLETALMIQKSSLLWLHIHTIIQTLKAFALRDKHLLIREQTGNRNATFWLQLVWVTKRNQLSTGNWRKNFTSNLSLPKGNEARFPASMQSIT